MARVKGAVNATTLPEVRRVLKMRPGATYLIVLTQTFTDSQRQRVEAAFLERGIDAVVVNPDVGRIYKVKEQP